MYLFLLHEDSVYFPFLKIFSAQKHKILKIYYACFRKILKFLPVYHRLKQLKPPDEEAARYDYDRYYGEY